jgi:uncharacterized protein with GYD domain
VNRYKAHRDRRQSGHPLSVSFSVASPIVFNKINEVLYATRIYFSGLYRSRPAHHQRLAGSSRGVQAEAAKLGVQVKDLFYTPGGPHDAAIVIEAEGPEPINKFMSSVQSLGNVKMKFIRAFSIEEMRKMR